MNASPLGYVLGAGALILGGFAACSSTQPGTAPVPVADGGSVDGAAGPADGSTDGGTATAAQACADTARARCGKNDACSRSTTNQVRYGSADVCVAQLTAQCLANLAAPGTGATPETVEGCAQAVALETCADYLGLNPPAACDVPAGAVATGSPCFASAQCQTSYCSVPVGAACGTCAALPKVGDACTTTGECGNRAALSCVRGACVTYAASGAACSATVPCSPGLSCVGSSTTAAGTCQPAGAAVGAPCDAQRKTAPGCDGTLGLYCGSAGTCVQEGFAGPGKSCGVIDDDSVRCTGGGLCVYPASTPSVGDAGAAPGACVAPAAVGGACQTSTGIPCLAPARCVVTGDGGAGTCRLSSAQTCP